MIDKNMKHFIGRRKFLGMIAGGAALSMMSMSAFSDKVKTKAKIVVIGAGAGGLSIANRLNKRLDGATITIIDGHKQHWYQPGFMLIASGVKSPNYSISSASDWTSRGIDLVEEYAAEIDAEAKYIVTASGKKVPYDYLVVASGVILDWEKIEGFDLSLVGREGVAAVYAGPEQAAKSYQALSKFTDNGGQALFPRPAGAIKCGAAPLKYTLITDDFTRKKDTREKTEITYAASGRGLIGIPEANARVKEIFAEREVNVVYEHVIKSVDHGKKTASFSVPTTFDNPEGKVELPYDFIHVIPPQRVADVILNSPLPSKSKQGWVEVDKHNLRHVRYPEIFSIGDVSGTPTGKGASAVKWMAPVVEDHLVAQIAGKEGTRIYNGYAGCPLITGIGKALLIENDYTQELTPTFPGIIDPMEELWASWLIKVAMKPAYYAMLRGKA